MKLLLKGRGVLFTALCLLLSSSLWAAGSTEQVGPSTDGTAAEENSLSIALLMDFDSIPLVLADMRGFYAREGVDVELQYYKNPVDRDTAFQAGAVDGSISDLLAAAFALQGDMPVKATSLTNGSYKLILAPGSDVTTLIELKGHSVGISKNTIIEYCTDRMTSAVGYSSEELDKAIIPQMPIRLEMLLSGKIDAATLPEPLATTAILKGGSFLDSSNNLDINPGILLFHQQVVENKAELVRAFYRAYNRSVEYINSHPQEEYIDAVLEQMEFDPKLKGTLVLPEYTPARLPPEKEVREVMEWLYERELIQDTYTYEEVTEAGFFE